jgi:DNA-binding transcriptional ArsR family regulator
MAGSQALDPAAAGPELPVPDIDEVDITQVLHALADPVRLEIVRGLAERGQCVCSALGLPQSPATISHHMKILRSAGIVATRVEGTSRPSRLRREDLQRRFPGLLDAVLAAGVGA